jgi:alpha-methylacyl-CoA racemase
MAVFTELKAQGLWRDGRARNFLDGAAPYYGVYACSDGEFVSLGPIEPQFYARFRELVGATDPVFDKRDDEAFWPLLRQKLADLFRTRTRNEWSEILDATDACFAPVLPLGLAHQHPHLIARETFFEASGIVQPSPAPRFSETPSSRPTAAVERSLEDVLNLWSRD